MEGHWYGNRKFSALSPGSVKFSFAVFPKIEEVENLEVQLGEEEKKLRSLREDHEKAVTEQKQSKGLVDSLKSKNLEHQHTILQLKGELQAQTDLVGS